LRIKKKEEEEGQAKKSKGKKINYMPKDL